jgi:hypothetical protein
MWHGEPPLARYRAQSLVEFALVLPIFLGIVMVAIQLSFLVMAQLTLVWIAHDVIRHVSTTTSGVGDNWALADSCHVTYRNSKLPSILQAANITQFSFTPAYAPGTVNCTNAALNSPATTRVRGGAVRLTMQYNPTNLLFLPTTFFGIPIRTTLPAYSVSAVME